ncbi:hypothetical protein A3K73_02125 [Candidatus Pacearchaeota archaeon RBG_13_36_9]|nr:MAG: hypothetical protein A3K73_02125 [Candidatus Pacearchaeota archaeon RBG_13_36_9]
MESCNNKSYNNRKSDPFANPVVRLFRTVYAELDMILRADSFDVATSAFCDAQSAIDRFKGGSFYRFVSKTDYGVVVDKLAKQVEEFYNLKKRRLIEGLRNGGE